MRNNNFNLQILHHSEVFATRQAAIEYIENYYRPYSLEAEPLMIKYQNEHNTNVINVMLAFGTTSDAPGGFYIIDYTPVKEDVDNLKEITEATAQEVEEINNILEGVLTSTGLTLSVEGTVTYVPDPTDTVIRSATSIAEAIRLLSEYTQENINDSRLSVEDTNSVSLIYQVNPAGGMILKAQVNISMAADEEDEDDTNNNIVGVKADGLYAAAHLDYDDLRRELVFTTSGYKDGRFMEDAKIERIQLGYHTTISTDNTNKNVELTAVESNSNYTLSAQAKISENEDNILENNDGALYVSGRASNISYANTNVKDTLDAVLATLATHATGIEEAYLNANVQGASTSTSTVTAAKQVDGGVIVTNDVLLGSHNSIVVANGGLEASVSFDINTATNTFSLTVGNQTVTKSLPGIEVIESAVYDSTEEQIVITFVGSANPLVIPVRDLVESWIVENPTNSPVALEKTVISGQTDKLSANLNLRSSDNLLGVENGKLYVSENNINSKVAAETTRATTAENTLTTSLNELSSSFDSTVADLEADIQNNATAITTERQRATTAEASISAVANSADDKVDQAIVEIRETKSQVSQISTDLTTLETTVETATESLDTRVTTNATAISGLTTSLQNEITRATGAESGLNTAITALSGSVDTRVSQLNGAITNETTRAQGAETALQNSITTLSGTVNTINGSAATSGSFREGDANTLSSANSYTDTAVHTLEDSVEADIAALSTSITTALATKADKTQTETALARKIESVTVDDSVANQYTINVDGVSAGTIIIPEDKFFEGASYDPQTKILTLVFITSQGRQTVNISIADLVDVYEAGDGISLTGNTFSIDINNETESYLQLSDEGIGIFGIDAALAAKADASDLTALEDSIGQISGPKTVAERLAEAEQKIAELEAIIKYLDLGSYTNN